MSQSGATPAVFEFLDSATAQATPDLLGLWTTQATSPPAPGAISFEVGRPGAAPAPADIPVWRTNLPADLAQARALLDGGLERLDSSRQSLPAAEDRLERLAAQQSATARVGVSFGVFEQSLPAPEADLLALMQEAENPGVSFGLGQQLGEGWQEACRQFQGFVERVTQVVANYAWVETMWGEQLLARSIVSWTGDFTTAWQTGLAPEQVELHRRNLRLALESRQTLIWTFTVAARGAIKLAVLATTPGGFLLAVPAAWKFINQVLAEYRERRPG